MALQSLVTRLQAIRRGQRSKPATKCMANRWGEFCFSATQLNSHAQTPEPELYLLRIEQKIPLKVRLIDKLSRYRLSNRQLQICLHISSGLSYTEIANTMGIKESTVISHRKALFSKLDISNRTELASAILS